MKKLIYILFIGLVIISCSKDENYLFDKSPDERIDEVLSKYTDKLTDNRNGWILSLETGISGGYSHWVLFDKNNRVSMLSDASGTTSRYGATEKDVIESSYRLKSVVAPILMFDTYSYIHMLADPNKDINGGTTGYGLKTDFEYTLGEYDNDAQNLVLKGRYNKKKAVLIPCNAEEYQGVKDGGLKMIHETFKSFVSKNLRFPVITIGSNSADLVLTSRSVAIKYISSSNGELVDDESAAYLDLSSISGKQDVSDLHLFNNIKFEDIEISGLSYKDGNFYANLVGKDRVVVKENYKPSIPFRFGYKKDYTSMTIDASKLENTLVDPYLTNVYNLAKTKINGNGGRNMQYPTISFELDKATGKPVMLLAIRYNNKAGNVYTAKWYFKYTVNDDGTITFTDRDQTGSSNERGQEPYLKPVVDYFCTFEYSSYSTSRAWSANKANVTKVTPRTFKLDWVENKTPGLSSSIGGLYPADKDYMDSVGVCCGIVK